MTDSEQQDNNIAGLAKKKGNYDLRGKASVAPPTIAATLGQAPICMIEAVKPPLRKFSQGAVFVRTVSKLCSGKEEKRSRVCVVTNYGIYICHFNGIVNRFIVFTLITKFMFFERHVLLRCCGQPDLLLEFTKGDLNTSNDMEPVISVLDRLCKRKAPPTYTFAQSTSLKQLLNVAVTTLPTKETVAGMEPTKTKVKEDSKSNFILQSAAALQKSKELELRKAVEIRSSTSPRKIQEIRDRVVALLTHYCPNKTKEVNEMFQRNKGKEEDMLAALVCKYGPEPVYHTLTTTPLLDKKDQKTQFIMNEDGSIIQKSSSMWTDVADEGGKLDTAHVIPFHNSDDEEEEEDGQAASSEKVVGHEGKATADPQTEDVLGSTLGPAEVKNAIVEEPAVVKEFVAESCVVSEAPRLSTAAAYEQESQPVRVFVEQQEEFCVESNTASKPMEEMNLQAEVSCSEEIKQNMAMNAPRILEEPAVTLTLSSEAPAVALGGNQEYISLSPHFEEFDVPLQQSNNNAPQPKEMSNNGRKQQNATTSIVPQYSPIPSQRCSVSGSEPIKPHQPRSSTGGITRLINDAKSVKHNGPAASSSPPSIKPVTFREMKNYVQDKWGTKINQWTHHDYLDMKREELEDDDEMGALLYGPSYQSPALMSRGSPNGYLLPRRDEKSINSASPQKQTQDMNTQTGFEEIPSSATKNEKPQNFLAAVWNTPDDGNINTYVVRSVASGSPSQQNREMLQFSVPRANIPLQYRETLLTPSIREELTEPLMPPLVIPSVQDIILTSQRNGITASQQDFSNYEFSAQFLKDLQRFVVQYDIVIDEVLKTLGGCDPNAKVVLTVLEEDDEALKDLNVHPLFLAEYYRRWHDYYCWEVEVIENSPLDFQDQDGASDNSQLEDSGGAEALGFFVPTVLLQFIREQDAAWNAENEQGILSVETDEGLVMLEIQKANTSILGREVGQESSGTRVALQWTKKHWNHSMKLWNEQECARQQNLPN